MSFSVLIKVLAQNPPTVPPGFKATSPILCTDLGLTGREAINIEFGTDPVVWWRRDRILDLRKAVEEVKTVLAELDASTTPTGEIYEKKRAEIGRLKARLSIDKHGKLSKELF